MKLSPSVQGAPVPILARTPAAQGHDPARTFLGYTTDKTVSSQHQLLLLEALQNIISFEPLRVPCPEDLLNFTLYGQALGACFLSIAATLLMLSLVHTQLLSPSHTHELLSCTEEAPLPVASVHMGLATANTIP